MRTVSLSNDAVQKRIEESFIPLKVSIEPGSKSFPLDWPAMRSWRFAYALMGGPSVKGITGCSVITPDRKIQLGHTGSAFVWEMFDSVAYDANRFSAMLDNSLECYRDYEQIKTDPSINEFKRKRRLARFSREVKSAADRNNRFHLPPQGFSAQNAIELFKLSGDIPGK
ncbi:hypothetical protein GC174_10195 [bacterium]|nr:hypothetical protein [bacterium]